MKNIKTNCIMPLLSIYNLLVIFNSINFVFITVINLSELLFFIYNIIAVYNAVAIINYLWRHRMKR